MTAPTLAVVTLHANGGGVAVVGNLLWRVFQQEWNGSAHLIALRDDRSAVAEKAVFGLHVLAAQLGRRSDFILFSHLGLARVQSRIPLRFRRPYGVFLHGIEAWTELSRSDRGLLGDATLRIANSHFTASRVMTTFPDIGPVQACPLGLLPGDAAEPAPAFDLPPLGPAVVLVVGRMVSSERYKGHDQLIDAWPRVVARVPNAQLVIVGTGDDERRLQARAAAMPVKDAIVFTGFVDRSVLNGLYERAAIFALPSRGEGFGLVYLEAMAHHLPCVGSVHDAASEVIVDGVTGRLVSQDDVPRMAETLTALLLDSSKRRAMGAAGYARLMREFTFDRFSVRLRDILRPYTVVRPLVEVAS